MRNYKIWNKQDSINGVPASHFLSQEPFKSTQGDIILIYTDDGKVSNVECKNVLAKIYGIDAALDIDSFMAEYFKKTTPNEA